MNICMVGTGYVGLVAGTCLSDFGMNVICVDKDEAVIDKLKRGQLPIYELGLQELIQRNVKLKRLQFSTDLETAVQKSLVIFLAVGTPEGRDGFADLGQMRAVALDVARFTKEYKIITIKSTVPVGTAKEIRELIKESLAHDVEFDVVSNPEFLREGAAVYDFLHPDRIILGCDSPRALTMMKEIYRPLYLLETPIISTNSETAELIKYAANAMLALRISFMNEVANLCDKVGADVYQVAVALGMDKRIGPKFLHPGPGFGGSCFPKDVKSLAILSKKAGYNFKLAEAVTEINLRQRELMVEKSRTMLGSLKGKSVCLLGLSFKPNTNDVREAPAIYIAKKLMDEGAVVHAFDPAAMPEARKALDGIRYFDDCYSACAGADLILIVTEWNEFRELDFAKIRENVRTPNIFDTRNIYDPATIRKLGFNYLATGRP
jgi:UDPglucose 6-dehydrogenase